MKKILLFFLIQTVFLFGQDQQNTLTEDPLFPHNKYKRHYDMGWIKSVPEFLELDVVSESLNITRYVQLIHGIPVFESEIRDKGDTCFVRIIPETKANLIPNLSSKAREKGRAFVEELGKERFGVGAFTCDLYIMPWEEPTIVWRIKEKPVNKADRKILVVNAETLEIIRELTFRTISIHPSIQEISPDNSSEESPPPNEIPEEQLPKFGFHSLGFLPSDRDSENQDWDYWGIGRGFLRDREFPTREKPCCGFGFQSQTWAFEGLLNELKTYEYPEDAPPDFFTNWDDNYIGNPGVNTRNYGTDHPSLADAQTLFFQINSFWADTSISPGTDRSFPSDEKKTRIVVELPDKPPYGEAYYEKDLNYFGFDQYIIEGRGPNITALDVVAHEYTHALLTRPMYFIESQAIEEGFADIMAVICESAFTSNYNWTIGEDSGLIYRDLSNPKTQFPGIGIDHYDNYFEREDSYVEHQLGTVLGLCFYLLSNGGRHPNPRQEWGPGPYVEAIGLPRAGEIFYRVLDENISDESSFFDIVDYCVLKTTNERERQSIKDAFLAVGVARSAFLGDGADKRFSQIAKNDRRFLRYHVNPPFEEQASKVLFSVEGDSQSEFELKSLVGYFPHGDHFQHNQISSNGKAVLELNDLKYGDVVYIAIEATETSNDLLAGVTVQTIDYEALRNGVPKQNQNGLQGTEKHYKLDDGGQKQLRIAGQTKMRVATIGGYGNVDLYLKNGGPASPDSYDHCQTGTGNNHEILIDEPSPGTWWVGLYGASNYSNVTVIAETRNETDLLPPATVNASDNSTSYPGSIHVSWSEVAEATAYKIFRAESESGEKTEIFDNALNLNFTDHGVEPNKTYYYWVKSRNTFFESDFSSFDTGSASQSALPSPPHAVFASNGAYPDKVTISFEWADNGGNGGVPTFTFFRGNTINGARSQIGTSTGSFNDTNIVPGTQYYYWVKATDNRGTSEYSEHDMGFAYIETLDLSPPENVMASDNEVGRIVITWDLVTNASNYKVYCGTNANDARRSLIGTTDVGSFVYTNQVPIDRTLYFWVRSENDGQVSNLSNYDTGEALPTPGAPPVPSWVEASDDSVHYVTIDWDKDNQQNPTYKLYRSIQLGGPKTLIAQDVSWFRDRTAVPGETYYYWVKAENSYGDLGFSSSDTGIRLEILPPPMVTNLKATDGAPDEVTISFNIDSNPIYGNPEFRIYRSETISGQKTYLGEGRVFRDRSGAPNQVYYYWVQVHNQAGNSAFAGPDEGSFEPFSAPTAPTGLTATQDQTAFVQLSWNSSPQADSYSIWRKISPTSGARFLAEVTDTTYQDTTTSPINRAHFYFVRAKRGLHVSDPSNEAIGLRVPTTLPPQPTWCEASDDNTRAISISWDTTGQTNTDFKVFRTSEPNGPGELIHTTPHPFYSDRDVVHGGIYYYWVIPSNLLGDGPPSPRNSGIMP